MGKIIIDPITRIEGHLKIEATVTSGLVSEANASGTMARGFESLLAGRDPRDATYITERICGVCFSAHGWTSSMAVEQAMGTTKVPSAAVLIRNLITSACWLHDHVLQFYHLSALDYLDLSVMSGYQGTDSYLLTIKDKLQSELNAPPVEGEYLGPFVPTYLKDSFCVSDLDTVATLLSHYLEALQIQVKAKKLSALIGGKQPHQSGIVAGGVTTLPTRTLLNTYKSLFYEIYTFIKDIYIKDVLALASGPLKVLSQTNVGVGAANYLSYGGFPELSGDFLYPAGAVVNDVLVARTRAEIEADILEDVTKAWYTTDSAGHPSVSQQKFDLANANAYSFVKAPRFRGNPMEVGPLARMMIALKRPEHAMAKHPAAKTFQQLLAQGMKPGAVARHAARALETQILSDQMWRWIRGLESMLGMGKIQIHDNAHWEPPATGQGVGMSEAPRGALGHWIRIANSKIERYACVVPSTWNASPKDAGGNRGPYEQALIGCPVPDEANPINVGRVIRSFDPCIACAVHLLMPNRQVRTVNVRI